MGRHARRPIGKLSLNQLLVSVSECVNLRKEMFWGLITKQFVVLILGFKIEIILWLLL